MALTLLLTLAQRPTDQYTLGYQSDTFVVRKGAQKETVARALPAPKTKNELSFRRDKRWAVWDARGLTTRDGEWTATDRFEAIATSPKTQEKDEIRATLAKIKAGKRSRAASGISGARRVGGIVYLLPRWDADDGTPWLEALVAIDLLKPHPKPRLLGTFGGLSLGRGMADDRLGVEDGLLSVAINAESGWGFGTYDPKKGRFAFRERGVRLLALEKDGRLIEETGYGTILAGRADSGRTIPWLETRGSAEFVPGDGPILVRSGDRVRNAVTGAEVRLPKGAAVRRASAGLLVFWPETMPRSARLYDPVRFEERARWEQGTK